MRPSITPSRVPWLVGGLLVVLLGVLAALQLRWLEQVEEADRQRLEAAAETALAAFAADVDREVSRAWLTFLPGPHGGWIPPELLEERWERWRETAPAPGLVRDVRLVDARPGAGRSPDGPPRTPPLRVPELLPELPGFRVPVDPPWALRGRERRDGGRRVLRVAFDREYLEGTILPELVRRHLVPVLGSGVEVRVTVAETGAPVYASDADLVGPFEWKIPLFDLLPPDDLRRLAFAMGFGRGLLEDSRGRPEGSLEEGGDDARELHRRPLHLAAFATLLDPPAGWTLEVRPAAGSLTTALARARRGNAAVVLGLLALLGTAAVALALYARRSQEMARRQAEFTAAVSHELRTPIAGIRSLADNLADGLVREPEQTRLYGEQIARQGARLTEMVEQVLALAAGGAAGRPRDPAPVDLAEVVREAVAEVTAGAPDAEVAVELPSALPAVLGERQALERAVANLVGNAVKHGGRGVAVRARPVAEGHEVAVEVSDRGPGIPPGERERLFEPFFRGRVAQDRQLPGSGLGLHLVRRIAAAHGGRVEVRSAPGRGSTFALVLPAHAEPAEAAAAKRPPVETGP